MTVEHLEVVAESVGRLFLLGLLAMPVLICELELVVKTVEVTRVQG